MSLRRSAQPVEYYMLAEPLTDGATPGYYAGQPIPAYVVDAFGDRYSYAGVAPRLRNGRYDLDALQPGEWLVEPGLVYFAKLEKRGGILKRLFVLASLGRKS